jgi:hypothetical protein
LTFNDISGNFGKPQVNSQAGMGGEYRGQLTADKPAAQHTGCRYPDRAGDVLRNVEPLIRKYLVDAGNRARRLERQFFTEASEAHASCISMKQQLTKFRFQFLDHARDNLRGNAEPRRRVAKIDGVGSDAKDAQCFELVHSRSEWKKEFHILRYSSLRNSEIVLSSFTQQCVMSILSSFLNQC